jgi:N-acetylneuraminic acid mutarotase
MSSRTPLNLALPLIALALLACGETTTPTQPEMAGNPAPAAVSLAAAANSWTERAPTPYSDYIYGYDLGMAPNSAGQSIVYAFGGTSSDEGGTGMTVKAYNVATNTWTGKQAQSVVFYSNGVGKIGSKLYFSGGYVNAGNLPDASRQLWAYDYSSDRMIAKANLPIFSAEGVSGVIDGKLYVLPGACNGNGYPSPGYCAEEQTRRFYRYDPVTNTWVTRRQAPHFHRHGAAAVLDGKFYVAGGSAEFGFTPVTALDVYDPATNTWRTLAPIPAGGSASGAALQGQFFVVVGGSAYAYNRVTNQWKARAAPQIFGSMARVTLDGLPHLIMADGSHTMMYTP